MKRKTTHEPDASVMDAAEVWDDAQQFALVLRRNLLKDEPLVKLQIPFSAFLAALDNFNQEELKILRKQVEERLAA